MTWRRGQGRRLLIRLTAGLLLCGLGAGLVAGCSSARSDLGTSDSSCYIALPTATRAVGARGHLIGVQLYTVGSLHRTLPALSNAFSKQSDRPPSSQRICVVAFSGSFTQATVSKPLGRPSGAVAIVAMKFPSNQLLGTVLVPRTPPHFGHAHIG